MNVWIVYKFEGSRLIPVLMILQSWSVTYS